jgi:hypothetical protein
MDVSGLIGLEGAALQRRLLGFEIAQIAHTMTAQAAVQPRAQGIRVQKLAHHRQQVIE